VTVVADTSVLCYLVLIGCVDIQERRFGSVLIPHEIADECRHPGAPVELRSFIDNAPDWLIIQPAPSTSSANVRGLDAGEAAAISLALVRQADLVVIDERAGRQKAQANGLLVSGTLGVIADAATRGWIDFDQTLAKHRTATNFRVAENILEELRRAQTPN
jgi:predicted nucleic acid-binding protein